MDFDNLPWRHMAVVKDLPALFSADELKSFLQAACDISCDVVDVSRELHTSLIRFPKPLTETQFSWAQIQINRLPFLGYILRLERIEKAPQAVLIQNVPVSLRRGELLTLFSDIENGVVSCQMYPALRKAVVTFASSSVVDEVLGQLEHYVDGVQLRLEAFYEKFHEPLLTQSSSHGNFFLQSHVSADSTRNIERASADVLVPTETNNTTESNQKNELGVERISVPIVKAKAIKQWFSKRLNELKEDVDLTEDTSDEWTVTWVIRGRKEGLLKTAEVLTELQDKLKVIYIDLDSKFAFSEDRQLVMKGLQDFMPDHFCEIFRRKRKEEGIKCVLGIIGLDEGHDDTIAHATPSRPTQTAGRRYSVGLESNPLSRSESYWNLSGSQIFSVGGTEIVVESGDITDKKVDILVSQVGTDLNLQGTTIGSAVVSKCPSMEKRLIKAIDDPSSTGEFQVFRTRVPPSLLKRGGLRSSCVFHVVLQRCDRDALRREMEQVVWQCLKGAVETKIFPFILKNSIAFPPLGIGRKFRFPPDVAIAAMVSSTVAFLQEKPHALKVVRFVVNDDDHASLFERFLKENQTDKQVAPSSSNIGLFKRLRQLKGKWAQRQETSQSKAFTENEGGKVDKFQAVICTMKKSNEDEYIVQKLTEDLRSMFLYEHCISPGFGRLSVEDRGRIRKEAAERHVVLGERDRKTFVRGQEAGVLKVAALVSDCHQTQSGITHHLPSYWQMCRNATISFESAIESWKNLGSRNPFGPVTADERRAVEKILKSTWETEMVGCGRDARNLKHTCLQVTDVVRLENPVLFEQYSLCRERMLRHFKSETQIGKRSPYTPIENLPKSSNKAVSTLLHSDKILKRDLYAEVNEVYLFHGTHAKSVVPIAAEGLDFRIGNESGLHGKGTYFAESATKSDQYADPRGERSAAGEDLTMILVRVVLGAPFVNTKKDNPEKFKRPPCRKCLQQRCDCTPIVRFDSVLDDAGRLFREFVIYDRNQCYPEYFITYKRVQ